MRDPEVGHAWHDGGMADEAVGARSPGAWEITVRIVCAPRKTEKHWSGNMPFIHTKI